MISDKVITIHCGLWLLLTHWNTMSTGTQSRALEQANSQTQNFTQHNINSSESEDKQQTERTTEHTTPYLQLVNRQTQTGQVYKRRWWLLAVFSLMTLAQNVCYNTWSPITDAVLIAFNWSDSFVTLFPALGNVAYALFAFPFMYIIDSHGECNTEIWHEENRILLLW